MAMISKDDAARVVKGARIRFLSQYANSSGEWNTIQDVKPCPYVGTIAGSCYVEVGDQTKYVEIENGVDNG